MRQHQANLARYALRALAVAGGSGVVAWTNGSWSNREEQGFRVDALDGEKEHLCCLWTRPFLRVHRTNLDAASSTKESALVMEHEEFTAPTYQTRIPRNENSYGTESKRQKQYDFVIIGYGTAGMNALAELRKACPSASIALLDPLRHPVAGAGLDDGDMAAADESSNVDYFSERVVRVDPRQRLVHMDQLTAAEDNDNEESTHTSIRYRCAVLLATGARGAPPPSYLMDDASQPHILELRPTVIPFEDQRRPVLTKDQVRRTVLNQVAAGAKVGILGSGFEAIELAVAAAAKSQNKLARPSLVFGNSAPLCHVLPPYLSSAVAKRLRSKRIDVQDRTLIRYVSHDEDQAPDDGKNDTDHKSKNDSSSLSRRRSHRPYGQQRMMHLHTAKSYDLLDSNQTDLDLLVLAPDTNGTAGCAAIPTDQVPDHLEDSANGRSWYQTWSELCRTTDANDDPSESSLIVCYKDDGRIAVNSELCACTGVFAAGSVAKLANGLTGHADVAGVGFEDGAAAGRVAALNMARHYYPEEKKDIPSSLFDFVAGGGDNDLQRHEIVTRDCLPIWRSDYQSQPSLGGGLRPNKTALDQIGITALCVGTCDSVRYSTHGVWWTNQSAQRRLFGLLEQEEEALGRDEDDKVTRRRTKLRRRRIKEMFKPVYGIGAVFYVDWGGRIQGIMTWGLPIPRGELRNATLVQHMKDIINTNGGFHHALESEMDHIRMSNFLAQESRRMVSMAFAGALVDGSGTTSTKEDTGSNYQLEGVDWEQFPRPLHRFSDVRPAEVRNLNALKRQGDGHGYGMLGQDLFARHELPVQDRPVPPPDFSKNVGDAARKAQSLYEWNVWEQIFKQWENNEGRARPAQEEPLWIRKGDEMRKVSHRDTVMTAYNSAIWSSSRKPSIRK